MEKAIICAAALGVLLGSFVFALGIFSFIGCILWAVWAYAVLAVWPTLPVITWWQFGLMAFGANMIKNLMVGARQ